MRSRSSFRRAAVKEPVRPNRRPSRELRNIVAGCHLRAPLNNQEPPGTGWRPAHYAWTVTLNRNGRPSPVHHHGSPQGKKSTRRPGSSPSRGLSGTRFAARAGGVFIAEIVLPGSASSRPRLTERAFQFSRPPRPNSLEDAPHRAFGAVHLFGDFDLRQSLQLPVYERLLFLVEHA
jgi:hypothetical protein